MGPALFATYQESFLTRALAKQVVTNATMMLAYVK